jgi:hypothetical protein
MALKQWRKFEIKELKICPFVLFTKYCEGDKIQKDDLGGQESGLHTYMERLYHSVELGTYRRTMFEYALNKRGQMLCKFIYLVEDTVRWCVDLNMVMYVLSSMRGRECLYYLRTWWLFRNISTLWVLFVYYKE